MDGWMNEWMNEWRGQAIRRLIITLLSDEARRQWTVLDRAVPDWVAVYPCTNSASPPCRTRWGGFSACYPGSWKTLRGPQDVSWWAGLLENQSRFRTRSPDWGLPSSDSVNVTPYIVFQALHPLICSITAWNINLCVRSSVRYVTSWGNSTWHRININLPPHL